MNRPHTRGGGKRRVATAPSSGPIEVTIDRLGAQGDGVAHVGGRDLYVPFTAPGDVVRVQPIAGKGPVSRGELEAVITPGPDRVPPACRHFTACGGCAVQHLGWEAYTQWKRGTLEHALNHAGLGRVPILPTITVPVGSRLRARMMAARVGEGVVLGFNAKRAHTVIDLAECPVTRGPIIAALPALRAMLSRLMPPRGRLDVALTDLDGGLDITLIGPLTFDLAAREALAAFAEETNLARLSWRLDDKSPIEPVAHRRAATIQLGGVTVEPMGGAFLQAAAEGAAALTDAVLAATDGLTGGGAKIADLFCGVGTFALPLARHAHVTALDGDADAIAALDRAQRAAGLNIDVSRHDLFREPLMVEALNRFDAVVFDPPRAGAAAQTAHIAQSAVPVVVGVSCDAGTFARDARALVDGGYRLESVQPVDQFLWSPHLEMVGVFRK